MNFNDMAFLIFAFSAGIYAKRAKCSWIASILIAGAAWVCYLVLFMLFFFPVVLIVAKLGISEEVLSPEILLNGTHIVVLIAWLIIGYKWSGEIAKNGNQTEVTSQTTNPSDRF
ncbi:hypothetical protein [Puniceicoccus vermicola]|uniref:Uncharacterized protein n=1 Tax=Puniceicoccus vermicola TaxID=388746 RepID=A0A7X1E437_9BACT|nr:hypothetical protein [Puniceicoccus vermicola]MBC2601624.1 hypothetical protein [Puniceicoccus vermicola]